MNNGNCELLGLFTYLENEH